MSETPDQNEQVSGSNPDTLAAVLEKLNHTLERTSRAPAHTPAPAAPTKTETEERIFSTEELQAMVDEGKITVSKMYDQLRYQDRKSLQKQFEQSLESRDAARKAEAVWEAKIGAYVSTYPDLAHRDSDAFQQYQEQLDELAQDGDDPENKKTQYQALRLAFGTLNSKRVKETTRDRKATQEVAGSPGSGDSGSDEGASSVSFLDEDLRLHYSDAVRKGRYKGWNDPQLRRELTRLRAKNEDWKPSKLESELAKIKTKKAKTE